MRSDALHRHLGKVLAYTFLLASAVTLSGCPFFLPTPGATARAPSHEVVLRIEPSVTTRTDILMTLGEPDDRVEDDRYFVYNWSETRAVIGVIIPAGYQAFPIGVGLGARSALVLEFGPDARVTRVKTFTRDMEGAENVGHERANTERLLWDDIHAWMKTADEKTPEGTK